MDLLKDYLERAAEIIGERTTEEEIYDDEIVAWIEKGRSIRVAITKANEKYRSEALVVEDALLPDLRQRYDYLLEHKRIVRKLQK